MKKTWIIDEQDAHKRLDVFLTEQLPDLTRSAIAKKLKSGAGTINSKPASVHVLIKSGDHVFFDAHQETQCVTELTKKSFKTHSSKSIKDKDMVSHKYQREAPTIAYNLDDFIIKDTPEWLVINKPAGLLVHPNANHKTGTLVDLLVAKYPAIKKIGEDPNRPGIVHRLDRDVSGLMVIAKTQDAFDELKKQFAARKTQKIYIALVYGNLPKNEGDIKFRIAHSSTKPRMAAIPTHETGGKAAWTHYRVLKRFIQATLVETQILSGRTHQIRAHFHSLGHPIIGDTLYTQKKYKIIETDHLLLQSIGLSFFDLETGEPLRFTIKLDPSFKKIIQTLTPNTDA